MILKELVEKAKEGDKDAFVRLIEINKTSMYKTAFSILKNDEDVADAIQDAVMAAFLNIRGLRNNAYFKTWLTKILINKCKDIIRDHKKYVLEEEYIKNISSSDDEVYNSMSSVYEELNGNIDMNFNENMNEYLSKLDDKYRVILLLFYGEDFEIKEIAQIMDMNVNTVKSRLKRGRNQLKKLMTEQEKNKRNADRIDFLSDEMLDFQKTNVF